MSVVMSIQFYPVKSADAGFLGNVQIAVTAESVPIIEKLRGAVRVSKFGGKHADMRHARGVPKKVNGKVVIDPKTKKVVMEKWYDQTALGDLIQKGLDAAVNLAWGKAHGLELALKPNGKWNITGRTTTATAVSDLIEGADEFTAAAEAEATAAIEQDGAKEGAVATEADEEFN